MLGLAEPIVNELNQLTSLVQARTIGAYMSAPTHRDLTRSGVRRIRDYIVNAAAEGKLAPGAKLPTERELAKRFAVPRNAVRRTLAQLEAEGSITRHVGRGTFLAGTAPAQGAP